MQRPKRKKKVFTDEFIFIVDASGSMGGKKRQEAQDGVNSFLEEQSAVEEGEAFVTIVLFESGIRGHMTTLVSRVELDMIRLTSQNYRVGYMTPLYEACIKTIEAHESDADSVTVIIATDGLENNSGREYTKRRLSELIKEKTAQGWHFIFLGQDIDAHAEGAKAGINRGTTAQTSSYERALGRTSDKVKEFRKTRNAERLVYTDDDREAMS